MNGLELARRFYVVEGAELIRRCFPDQVNKIAAGLVGDGSECFGFDDDWSRDHDWSPGFCLWLSRDTYEAVGADLQREVETLPTHFAGIPLRPKTQWNGARIGVFEIRNFYQRFIDRTQPPFSLDEWRRIPEWNLAAATNGRVFHDPLGEFTYFRQRLLAYYPEDVRLKKIARRCAQVAQSGQYNFRRSFQRGEYVAAFSALAEFIRWSISLVFLLNRAYCPFYKWMHRALRRLPFLGAELHPLLNELVVTGATDSLAVRYREQDELVDRICGRLVDALHEQNLTRSSSGFLLDHAWLIMKAIRDEELRESGVWID